MNNEADSEHLDSVQVLERQDDSEAASFELTSVRLEGNQIGEARNFPIMLFESSADVAAGPAATNSDRLI